MFMLCVIFIYFNLLQILSGWLVDIDGIIYPKAFYNFLTAWTSNDALAYSASDAAFYPEPKQWIHDPSDYNLISKFMSFLSLIN